MPRVKQTKSGISAESPDEQRQRAELTFAQLTGAASHGDSPLTLTALSAMSKHGQKAAQPAPWAEVASWVGVVALIVVLIAITVSVVTLR